MTPAPFTWAACLRQALAILFVAGVATGVAFPFVGSPWLERKKHSETLGLSPSEVGAATVPVLWVDARKEQEKQLHPGPPGAISLSEDNWNPEPLLLSWKPPQLVVVFCGGAGCQASRKVAEQLAREMPDLKARHLLGGLPAWLEYQSAKKVGGRP